MFPLAVIAAASVEMVIAAAGHLRRVGAFAPFASCPPVPAVLVSAMSVFTGGTTDTAYWIVAALAWLAGGWGVRREAVRWGAGNRAAWLAAGMFLVAPSRVWMTFVAPDLPRLLFWTFAVLAAGELQRLTGGRISSRWLATALLVLLAIGSHPFELRAVDLIAALEITAFFIVCALGRLRFGWALAAAATVSLAALYWNLAVTPHYRYSPGDVPPELRAWLSGKSAGSRVFQNEASVGLIEQPGLALVSESIQSPSSGQESLLWLRAFAVEYFVSANWQKYHSRLETVFERDAWCVYRLPAPNPAEAVLVSFPVWRELPEIRSIQDDEALRAYLDWSGRPEQAGIEWKSAREALITADLGEFDAILVRRAATPGWRAWVRKEGGNEQEFPVGSDPLGFMVLAPRLSGRATVRLRYEPELVERLWPAPPRVRELSFGAFPAISPNGIVDAVKFRPPPFAPGAVISIFGGGFVDGATRVLVSGQPVAPLYTGPNQINLRLPESMAAGRAEIVVEVQGVLSLPMEIEVAAP